MNNNNSLTALKGVRVGHSTHPEVSQGLTVVIFDKPCPVACSTKGGIARTYDASHLGEGKSSYIMHGIFIADGGHAGLECASEVIRGLREKGIGWQMNGGINPSITGACVLSFLFPMKISLNPAYGYEAVLNLSRKEVSGGNIGAGTGTMVGKFSWTENWKCLAMKAGIGFSRINLGKGVMVCVLTVVNALGNVVNYDGTILAGNRNDKSEPRFRTFDDFSRYMIQGQLNTTISIVGTNAKIACREDLRKIAEIAGHGQIRAINPVNTSIDGDTVFAFTTNEIELSLSEEGKSIGDEGGDWWKFKVDILSQAAAKAVQESIYDACYKATTIKFKDGYKGIIPSVADYKQEDKIS